MSNVSYDSCVLLWSKYLMTMIDDAMGAFNIPSKSLEGEKEIPPLNVQYDILREKFLKEKNGKVEFLYREQIQKNPPAHNNACNKARLFLESSRFDEVANIIGYDSEFISRTFSLVQEAITLEKRLWEELKGENE